MSEEMACVSRTVCPGMEEVSPCDISLRYRRESHRVATKVAEMGALSVKPAYIFAFSFVHSFILFLNLLIY